MRTTTLLLSLLCITACSDDPPVDRNLTTPPRPPAGSLHGTFLAGAITTLTPTPC